MEVRPGYKQTEVGVIPEEWQAKALASIGSFSKGQGIRRNEAASGSLPCIRYGEIYTHHDDIVRGYNSYISPAVAQTSRRLSKGDILFAGSGETKEEIGKAVAYVGEDEVYAGSDIVILSPRSDSSEFLGYLLNSPIATRQKASKGQGDAVVHISASALGGVVIPIPPLPEQRAIATVLSDVDELLGRLDRLIAKKRDLKQAAMQQLLTGQTRLPGFRGEWGVKRLGEVADVKTGPFGSSLHESDYVQDGTPIITVEHLGEFGVEHFNLPLVSDFDRRRLQAYSLTEGDIVFSRVGSIDRNALIRRAEAGWLFSGRLLRVRLDSQKAYAPFLSFQFHSEPFKALVRSVAVGQTMASLNTRILNGVFVSLPSVPEQTAIAAVLSDMDAELVVLEARHDKTRALKQAMMQELLTGKTRLVTASSNVVSVDFAIKPKSALPKRSATKPHNWQINEAVVVAVLVKQFGSEKYPLGRKRCTKLAYLLHRHVEHVAEGYLKKAAGPYNPAVKYKGPEDIAQKNGYIRAHQNGTYSGFVAADNIGQAEDYFVKWYGQEVLVWLEQFRRKSNDELELLTTVDLAVVEIERAGKQVRLEAVKSIIGTHPEWEAKLERAIFSDTNITRAIRRVSELFSAE